MAAQEAPEPSSGENTRKWLSPVPMQAVVAWVRRKRDRYDESDSKVFHIPKGKYFKLLRCVLC